MKKKRLVLQGNHTLFRLFTLAKKSKMNWCDTFICLVNFILNIRISQKNADTTSSPSVKSFSKIGLQTLVWVKSASNRGILKDCIRVLHVHVLFVAPLCTGYMAQPGTDQHKSRVTIWRTPHHTGVATGFPVEPFNDIVGADASPSCSLGKSQ